MGEATAVRSLKKRSSRAGLAFGLGLLVGSVVILPFALSDGGVFWFYGDFNAQQIPFYQSCHAAVRSGQIFWDFQTDLGTNFIGSYSFYLLGSPFFWLTLPFPNAWVPYLMGPLMMLKLACCSWSGYLYLRRFTKESETAVVGGLLYAFSGFSVSSIFFNHFHESILLFPLLLLALEQFMTEKRRGFFAAMVFLCALNNYVFFFAMAVFLVFYIQFRCAAGQWKVSLLQGFLLIFEGGVGLALSAVLLLPALLAVLDSARLGVALTGWEAFAYADGRRPLEILLAFLFPAELPGQSVLVEGSGASLASLSGWLPVFGLVGAFAFLRGNRGHWLRRLLLVCTAMALIPLLNSVFSALQSTYYARWFFMPVLMLCLATVLSLEDDGAPIWFGYRWTAGLTVVAVLALGLYPQIKDGRWRLGLFRVGESNEETVFRFWVMCGLAVGSLLIAALLLSVRRRLKQIFWQMTLCSVICISVLSSLFFVWSGKALEPYDEMDHSVLLNGFDSVSLPTDSFSRIDVISPVENTGMYLRQPSIESFHSVLPASISEFYEWMGQERTVVSHLPAEQSGARALLSVRWLLQYRSPEDTVPQTETPIDGFVYRQTQNGFDIYENTNYIPMGFTYSHAMSKQTAAAYGDAAVDRMMLKALLLEDKDLAAYSHLLPALDLSKMPDLSNEAMAADCAALRQTAATVFQTTTKGFSATVSLPQENLVFFSVPYTAGWTATMDGVSVPIVKAGGGMMAVPVTAGEHTVSFTYETPGLRLGLSLTGSAVVILGLYLLVVKLYRKDHPAQPEEALPLSAPFAGGENQIKLEEYLNVQQALSRITMELEAKKRENSEETDH